MPLLAWGTRRKFLYTAVGVVVLFVLIITVWAVFFTSAPTCFDGTQNAGEAGVDCGGACALLCEDQSKAPVVLWSRSFEHSPNTYIAAAYIQNNNVGAGAREVSYTFQLLDKDNILVTERTGVIDLPPVVTIPIIETNIDIGNRDVARTLFSFSERPVWRKVSPEEFKEVRVSAQDLNSDASRLSVKVMNDGLESSGRLVVTAVLFDTNNVARSASQSILDSVDRKSSQDVVFTWPGGVPNIVRAEITVLPSF